MNEEFKCADCGQTKPINHDGGTGYAIIGSGDVKICYDCVAIRDRQEMINSGTSRHLPLYIARHEGGVYYVSNWPGSLRFDVRANRFGEDNIGRTRHDVWFNGPDGFIWHGVQIGDYNTICHAKRTKERSSNATFRQTT